MAIAGKVAITLSTENGGAWSADVTYDRLVAVKHNNNLYISRKAVANVEPPNNEFWFLALEGFGGDDVEEMIQQINALNVAIEEILDGTTQVGNAKTLDGYGAEYFFPKSGGEINGNVFVKSATATNISAYLQNSVRNILSRVYSDGSYKLFDMTNNKDIIVSSADGTNTFNGTASGNLPLTGGTVHNANIGALTVRRDGAAGSAIKYENADKVLGYLGIGSSGKPLFFSADLSSEKELLHTGNKPTGTYTGNGDATTRTINIGGINGGVLVVRNSNYSTLVFDSGAISIDGNGTITGIPYREAHYTNNVLTLATTNVALNQNGTNNTYYV